MCGCSGRAPSSTSPLGLTEPLFVPEYWNPPSLLELAQRTGFDLESLIFSFAIGGIGAVLYDALARRELRSMSHAERLSVRRHRFHALALTLPHRLSAAESLAVEPDLSAIAALAIGGAANAACRPDLTRNTLLGGAPTSALLRRGVG